MKTPKTFLAEAPKIKPMDWKDAFKMLIYFSIETEAKNFQEDYENVKQSYTDEVKGLKDEAQSEWDEMDEDEQEEWEDMDEWFEQEYWDGNSDYLSVSFASISVKMKSTIGEDVFGDAHQGPPPMMGDNGDMNFEVVMDTLYDEADSWEKMIMKFDGFGGTGKQMAIDAKKKLKIDWKINNPDDLVNDVISIFLGYTKTKPTDSISKLMLKPNFGINADKKEWANFCKKPETYDRKWWVSLQKEFGKYS